MTSENDVLEHAELGVRAPSASSAAVDYGLVSLDLHVGGRRSSARMPAWFTPSALRLPAGAVRAGACAAGHFAGGMSLLLGAASAAAGLGVVAALPALTGLATAALIVLLSVVVHEVGHVVAYRLVIGYDSPAVAVVSGANCRIIRLRSEPRADALVALAGPLAPLPVAAAMWSLWPVAPYVVIVSTLVAIGHVAGLVLPVGDGMTVRELLRSTSTP